MSSFQRSSSSNEEKKRLRNERDRERRKNETPQQREARLAKRRVKDATSYKIYGVTMTILHNWLELAPLMQRGGGESPPKFLDIILTLCSVMSSLL